MFDKMHLLLMLLLCFLGAQNFLHASANGLGGPDLSVKHVPHANTTKQSKHLSYAKREPPTNSSIGSVSKRQAGPPGVPWVPTLYESVRVKTKESLPEN